MVETVTVSSKGQVTIPADLRKDLEIEEGEKLIVVKEGRVIKMIPVPRLSRLAGVDKEVFRGREPSKEIEDERIKEDRDFEKRLRET
mgnify:CR=1 FL=1